MRNYIAKGEALSYTNAGAPIASGDPVIVGEILCVAAVDIGTGETGTVGPVGCFQLTKLAGTAINQGDLVDYDVSAAGVTKLGAPAAGDLVSFGYAYEGALAGAIVVNVVLTPGTATLT